MRPRRRRTGGSRGLALGLMTLCLSASVSAPASAAETRVSGSYVVREGVAPTAGLDYAFDGPLLTGPDASARLDVRPPLPLHPEFGATSYVPMQITSILAAPHVVREWRPCTPLVARGSCGLFTDPPGCSGPLRRPTDQSVEASDPRALLRLRSLDLDVLGRRGEVEVSLPVDEDYSHDPASDPYLDFEFQATGLLRVTTTACRNDVTGEPELAADGSPFREVAEVPAVVANGGAGFVAGWGVKELDDERVELRLSDGVWRGSFRLADAGNAFSGATETRVTIALEGTPIALRAACWLPRALASGRAKRRAAVVRSIRRAGWAGVRIRARDRRPRGGRFVVHSVPFERVCHKRVTLRRVR